MVRDFHVSVMLSEAVDALHVEKGKKYIDATLGGGGHAIEIVKRGGIVLGIDVDLDAINYVEEKIKNQIANSKNATLVRGNFLQITEIARENGFEEVSGILFDLGVSSYQFDKAERGFSFQREGPLDMRMDQSLSVKAADLINGLTKAELTKLFDKYGEERFAKKIAGAIVKARLEQPIHKTTELSGIIERTTGIREKIHPATRVFQALRIAVNDEIHVLEDALGQSVRLLEDAGRIVVISFHSLEDRVVKRAFLEFEDQGLGSMVTRKPILPSEHELRENPRARSAKLRVFARTTNYE
ncbi:MAG: 16S rRNA (cytosine(1402)-N(4))-methyltransferase RsmH [Candidatus Levybacteria bacterium]|nr:16S rRNA (cytosine(1402)-N(4))-methyltransferase RsmH [Candidatus Levybacteria bacterium]